MNRRQFFRSIAAGILTGAALVYAPRLLKKPAVRKFEGWDWTIRARVDRHTSGSLQYLDGKAVVVFTSGKNKGQVRTIASYDAGTYYFDVKLPEPIGEHDKSSVHF